MSVTFDVDAPAAVPRDAATVVLLRDGTEGLEVFFVKRRAEVRFMGGAYVFPGGKLDTGDTDSGVPTDLARDEAARRLGEADGVRSLGLHVAALRECLEEAGVLFARETVSLDEVARLRHACDVEHRALRELLSAPGVSITLRVSALVPLARWVTPVGETRRFDARFFLAAAPAGVSATHDTRETVASEWLRPARAIERAHAGEIVLVPPTYRTVEWLMQQRDTAAALAAAPGIVPRIEPVVHLGDDDGVVIIALPGDPLHPEPLAAMARGSAVDPARFATRFVYTDGAWAPARAPT